VTELVASSRPPVVTPDWPEEAALVERARCGDHAAYRALVRRYEQLAFRTAYLVVGSTADAEDVAQDAFVKAYQALGRFRAGAPFRPWLLRIVANEARNRRRSSRRRECFAERLASIEPTLASSSPEDRVVAGEDSRQLLDALDRLSPDDRLAVLARYVLGLSELETAAVLGVRRAAAKTRIFRALRRLRADLEGRPE
jgi:RNA polymerase sigma factor (sigma-70 family)